MHRPDYSTWGNSCPQEIESEDQERMWIIESDQMQVAGWSKWSRDGDHVTDIENAFSAQWSSANELLCDVVNTVAVSLLDC